MAKTTTGQTLRGTLTGDAMNDWGIRFGDIITIIGFAGTCILYAYRSGKFAEGLEHMKKQLDDMKDVTRDIAKLMVQVAIQDVRLNTFSDRQNITDQRLEELRKGNGFALPKKLDHLP